MEGEDHVSLLDENSVLQTRRRRHHPDIQEVHRESPRPAFRLTTAINFRHRRTRRIIRCHPISTSHEPSPHWPPSRLLQEASACGTGEGPDLTIPPVHRGQPPARRRLRTPLTAHDQAPPIAHAPPRRRHTVRPPPRAHPIVPGHRRGPPRLPRLPFPTTRPCRRRHNQLRVNPPPRIPPPPDGTHLHQ